MSTKNVANLLAKQLLTNSRHTNVKRERSREKLAKNARNSEKKLGKNDAPARRERPIFILLFIDQTGR